MVEGVPNVKHMGFVKREVEAFIAENTAGGSSAEYWVGELVD